jgi:hypothetical protein
MEWEMFRARHKAEKYLRVFGVKERKVFIEKLVS